MIDRILYSSLADVSLPNGPGVNERGFLKDMLQRYGERLFAVIPRPGRGLPEELSELPVRFIPAHGSTRSPLGWAAVRTLGAPILMHAITRFRPDLVVLRAGAVPLSQSMTFRRHAVPYVIKTAGDVTHRGFYAGGVLRRLARPINQRMVADLLVNAHFVDVVTEAQRKLLVEQYPGMIDRVAVIDNGVDIDLFRRTPDSRARSRFGFRNDEIVIGYVGNRPMQRGGKEVIDVVAALQHAHPIRGIVVGDSGEAEACRAHAVELGVAGRVVIFGEAAYSQVPTLMADIDIGLSILRPAERLASEQKVRQYLASGLCVVNTDGSNDFLRGQEFAHLTATHETAEVTNAVEPFVRLGRPGLTSLGRSARAFAEANLSIAARNDRRLDYWEQALASPARRVCATRA